jgi:GTP-binding protein Era
MMETEKTAFLSGFIAIVGPPNVGKSTLLNQIVGEKVAIVSPKPQTTRNRILGIYNSPGCQMVFIDTPGIHRSYSPLHKSMVASAQAIFSEVDIVGLMVDMLRPMDPQVSIPLDHLQKSRKPSLLMVNKIDAVPKESVLPVLDYYAKKHPFEALLPISALTGDGIQSLLEELRNWLKPGPQFFPPQMKTDLSESFFIAEIIREKVYHLLRKELPYATAVTVERIQEVPPKNHISITATLHVESESQKGILIGKGGRMIKAVGRKSRLDLEKFFGVPVFLDLLVRVERKWSRNPKALERLGY